MTLLDLTTPTLVGARGGLGLLACMAMFACAHAPRPASAIGRVAQRLFATLSGAIVVFQVPRLAWILSAPREIVTRLLDLGAVLVVSGCMVGAIAVFALLRGEGAERVRRGILVNVLVFAPMVAVGWCFR